MSATVIRPNQWRINNIDNASSITKNDEVITIDSVSATSQYMIFELPTRLPTQTKIRVVAEARYISGEEPRLAIEFNNSDQHDGTKRFEKYTPVPESGDWREIEAVELVKPGFPYARVIFGYFQGTASGKAELRNVRMEVSAGADDVFPILQEPVTYSKAWDAESLAKAGDLATSGAGTMTLNSGILEGNSPDASSKAYLVLGAELTSKTIHHRGAKFVRLRCNAKKISGTCGFTVEFLSTYGSGTISNTRKVEFISEEFSEHTANLAVPDGTEVIRILCGATTAEVGQFEIKSLKVDILGGEVISIATPLVANIKKISGAWEIDDGQGRFGVIGLTNIYSNAAGVTLNYEGSERRPSIVAQTMSFSSGEDYIVKVSSITDTAVILEFFHVTDPTVVIDPSTVVDGTVVQLLGMGEF